MTSNEMEAANRAEATALLIRAGYRVYRPEADCYGEDLVVRTPTGELRPQFFGLLVGSSGGGPLTLR